MADISQKVRALSMRAWQIRRKAPAPCHLPFALALFTDDRRQRDIISALKQLPSAQLIPPLGVIFRHDGLPPAARQTLGEEARHITQMKGHYFIYARGRLKGADGHHGGHRSSFGFTTMPVHNLREGQQAQSRHHALDLGFISPLFPTQSHPGAPALGVVKGANMAKALPFPCFALGGITPTTAKRLVGSPFQGIAALGAFTE
ncbi:MAG: thiamine phosphate synthase [Pseudomonadota bacterium]